MTIAIAAYGPNAGRAVCRGLRAAEILGRGAIGGFAVFSVIDRHGRHRQVSCQDGGIAALPLDDGCLAARYAAVISSGPNRPEPLSQFLVGAPDVGLVSGHRLPNRIGAAQRPVNLAALDRMASGLSPSEAVEAVTRDDPELDFGLVAVSVAGGIGFANTARVARRADLGAASRVTEACGYALLCNSIHAIPGLPLDRVVGNIVWAELSGADPSHAMARLDGPARIETGAQDRIDLDDQDRVVRICSADPAAIADSTRSTVIYSRTPVWKGGHRLGTCLSEVSAPVRDGRILCDPAAERHFIIERERDGVPAFGVASPGA